MALWGNKDLRQANTGTTDRATVTGTTTCTFAANTAGTRTIKAGQWITITDCGTAMVKSVTNATVITLESAVTNGATKAWYTSDAPKHLATSATEGTDFYGVDKTEQSVATADLGGNGANNAPHHAGWVRRIDKGSGRTPRYRYETLVAMGSISGDAEDTDFVDS